MSRCIPRDLSYVLAQKTGTRFDAIFADGSRTVIEVRDGELYDLVLGRVNDEVRLAVRFE